MQARDRLGIPSHALLLRALFPPALPGFFFGFWQVNFAKPLEITFFLLSILI
jgi:hypothetical protein